MVNAVLPWAPRAERKAAVKQARDSADTAQARAEKARHLEADLRRVLADNHFAQIISQGITGHQQRGD